MHSPTSIKLLYNNYWFQIFSRNIFAKTYNSKDKKVKKEPSVTEDKRPQFFLRSQIDNKPIVRNVTSKVAEEKAPVKPKSNIDKFLDKVNSKHDTYISPEEHERIKTKLNSEFEKILMDGNYEQVSAADFFRLIGSGPVGQRTKHERIRSIKPKRTPRNKE